MPAIVTLSVKVQRPPKHKLDALNSTACASKASAVIKISSVPPDESGELIMELVHLRISSTFCVDCMRVT